MKKSITKMRKLFFLYYEKSENATLNLAAGQKVLNLNKNNYEVTEESFTGGNTFVGLTFKEINIYLDSTKMTELDLQTKIESLVSLGVTNISINLATNASKEMFAAINTGIANAADGSIILTVSGTDTLPENAFSELSSIKNLIFNNPLTKVHKTAFNDVNTGNIVLTLADGQKVLKFNSETDYYEVTEEDITSSAVFCDNSFLILIDAKSMSSTELETAVTKAISNNFTYISVNLASNADSDTFTALNNVINNNSSSGTINLTLSGATTILKRAFYGNSKLKTLLIGNDVKTISESAFHLCNYISSVIIGDEVTSISDNAFRGCSGISSLVIGENVVSIGDGAFLGCKISSLVLGKNLNTIGKNAFQECKFSKLIIPDSVTIIDNLAFYKCSNLQEIIIGKFLNVLGERVFCACSKVKTITISEENLDFYIGGNSIINKTTKTLVAGFANSIIPSDETVVNIGNYAFYGCTDLTTLTIPNNITTIEYYAFSNCTSLKNIYIGKNVTEIAFRAFYKCSALGNIVYGGTMEQWNAITKASEWNYGISATKVICTDGEVTL